MGLNLLLCFGYGVGNHPVLNRFVLFHAQRIHNFFYAVRTKNAHQIVFQREKKFRTARISLTAGTTSKLVVNPAGLISLRAQQ